MRVLFGRTYGVHAKIMADTVSPSRGGTGALVGVVDKPFIDILQAHTIIRCLHQSTMNQFRIRLFDFCFCICITSIEKVLCTLLELQRAPSSWAERGAAGYRATARVGVFDVVASCW